MPKSYVDEIVQKAEHWEIRSDDLFALVGAEKREKWLKEGWEKLYIFERREIEAAVKTFKAEGLPRLGRIRNYRLMGCEYLDAALKMELEWKAAQRRNKLAALEKFEAEVRQDETRRIQEARKAHA